MRPSQLTLLISLLGGGYIGLDNKKDPMTDTLSRQEGIATCHLANAHYEAGPAGGYTEWFFVFFCFFLTFGRAGCADGSQS